MKRSATGFWVIAVVAVMATLLTSMPAAAREKIVVGVASFSDESGKNLGGKATDAVINTFVELKYFRVVERNRIDQIMKEVAHQQTGMVDAAKAVEVGKQLGAQAMVVGSVSGAGYNIVKNEWKDDKGNIHVSYTAKGTVSLNVRIVDVETGEVIFAETITGNASDTVSAGSQPQGEGVLIDKAVLNAARLIFGPIQKKFPLTGYVLKVEGQEVWVDFGTSWGVGKARKVSIYREGEPIVHPKTGKVIGRNRQQIAVDHVSEAQEDMCKVKLSKKEAAAVKVGDMVEAEPQFWRGMGM